MADEYIYHHGIQGMHWGVRRTDAQLGGGTTSTVERTAYGIGAKVNPREFAYKLRKLTNNPNTDTKFLADLVEQNTKMTGVLTTNPMKASASKLIPKRYMTIWIKMTWII